MSLCTRLSRPLRALRVLVLALGLFVLLVPSRASAYPWMIKHGYPACVPCHTDPSGSGPLTAYGRVIGDSLLTTPLGGPAQGDAKPGSYFGLLPTPDWLQFGGDVRGALYANKITGSPESRRAILMRADLSVSINTKHFVAHASGGYAHEGALGAAVTRNEENNFVSREHWLGYTTGEENTLMLRFGRMNLPFGVRTIEHNLWVRKLTHTDINDQQQLGLAAAWAIGRVRGELMGILGNYQLRPDDYRERGYSTFLEWAVSDQLALGASSLITHRKLDPSTLVETWRQVHGVFARISTPWEPLALLTEWDYTLTSPKDQYWSKGIVGYLQADLEAAQGVHFLLTGEAQNVGVQGPPPSWGLWLTYNWFLLPHTDLRIDGIYQSLGSDYGRVPSYTLLFQGHVYL
ncbi:MAG TPA: hypothetical protein VER96_31150 [Polyangiaceae bacterium]|nr:hypothetical protein [Polyangiaceae bacterium]